MPPRRREARKRAVPISFDAGADEALAA